METLTSLSSTGVATTQTSELLSQCTDFDADTHVFAIISFDLQTVRALVWKSLRVVYFFRFLSTMYFWACSILAVYQLYKFLFLTGYYYGIPGLYTFAMGFLSFLFLSSSSSSFSSPNLSGHRLDVYHTSTHGVALVRI